MILVTGATGFIGRNLLPRLQALGLPVRILLRPSGASPDLPRSMQFDVALASMTDRRGLRAALVGVDQVIHLASAESYGHRGDLERTDVQGMEYLVEAAEDAGVRRIIFLSHLGSSPSSAFPLLRSKAAAERHLEASPVPHLILRCGLVFGPGDRFTTPLVSLIRLSPGVFPLPAGGRNLIHPLWIQDLITCLEWVLEESELREGRYAIGGAEHLSMRQVSELVMEAAGVRRALMTTRAPYLRGAIWGLERLLPHSAVTTHAIDYLAANRTAPLNSMVRFVGLQPAGIEANLSYLRERSWRWSLFRKSEGLKA